MKNIFFIILVLLFCLSIYLFFFAKPKETYEKKFETKPSKIKKDVIKIYYSGRFGNNLIQLMNVLDVAINYYKNIKLPTHEYFDTKYLENVINTKNTNKQSIPYYIKERSPLPFLFNNTTRDVKTQKIVRQMILKSFKLKHYPKISKENLVIHIRSGDIFINPHPFYTQPPFSFYKNIIETNNYKKIIIVSEDKSNPVLNLILSTYPNSSYTQRTLTDDMKILLGAEHIVQSIGSFIPAITYLSKYTKKVYKTKNSFSKEPIKVVVGTETLISNELYEVKEYNYDDYFLKMKDWKLLPEQINMMKTYHIPN